MTEKHTDPSRTDIDQLAGPALIEFGATDCGYCQRSRPWVDALIKANPTIKLLSY